MKLLDEQASRQAHTRVGNVLNRISGYLFHPFSKQNAAQLDGLVATKKRAGQVWAQWLLWAGLLVSAPAVAVDICDQFRAIEPGNGNLTACLCVASNGDDFGLIVALQPGGGGVLFPRTSPAFGLDGNGLTFNPWFALDPDDPAGFPVLSNGIRFAPSTSFPLYINQPLGPVNGRFSLACDWDSSTGFTNARKHTPVLIRNVSNVSCNGGNDGRATATPTLGTEPYDIRWSDGQTTATATNLSAGDYTVRVRDSSVPRVVTRVDVTITEPASALRINRVAVTDASQCSARDGALTITASGGRTAYQYSDDNGASFQSGNRFNGLAPSRYDLVVRDANRCTANTSVTVGCSAEADLSITKMDDSDPVIAGNTLGYTLQVSNAGPDDANNVVVTDTLPAGVTLLSTSGCAEDPIGVPTCNLGTIAAGSSALYTINVAVDASTSGTITNMASVSADEGDPNTGNNIASEDTTVTPQADLSITQTDSPDPVNAGDELAYTLTVSNAGPSLANNVVLTNALPADVTLVSTSGCAEDPLGAPTCSLGIIAAGNSAMATINVRVNASATGTITNMASVSADEDDPDSDNNGVNEDTTVNASGSINIIKEVLNLADSPADTAFDFQSADPIGNFTLVHQGVRGNPDLPIGQYTITEVLADLWTLENVSCTGATNSTIDDSALPALTIDLAAGENVECTFQNRFDDGDGVDADTENRAPGGDGNFDGTADRQQSNVASLPSLANGCSLTLTTPVATQLMNVQAIPTPGNAIANLEYPCEMVEFDLNNLTPGAQAAIEVFVHPSNFAIDGYLKFNHQSGFWDNIAENISNINGATRIRFTLIDGGPYDADGAVNGVISDPGGPVTRFALPAPQVHPIPTLQNWGLLAMIVALWAWAVAALRRRRQPA